MSGIDKRPYHGFLLSNENWLFMPALYRILSEHNMGANESSWITFFFRMKIDDQWLKTQKSMKNNPIVKRNLNKVATIYRKVLHELKLNETTFLNFVAKTALSRQLKTITLKNGIPRQDQNLFYIRENVNNSENLKRLGFVLDDPDIMYCANIFSLFDRKRVPGGANANHFMKEFERVTSPFKLKEELLAKMKLTHSGMVKLPPAKRGSYLLYFGPPGTGKTREAKRKAAALLGLDKKSDWDIDPKTGRPIAWPEWTKRVNIVQFHPGYSYEEFVEGIRPITDHFGDIKYEVIYGPFMRAYTLARGDYFPVPCYKDGDTYYPVLEVMRAYGLDSEGLKLEVESNHTAKNDSINSPEKSMNASGEKSLTPHIELIATPQKELPYVKVGLRVKNNAPKGLGLFILIVDELNRAKVSKVFGELLYAIADLDDDQRAAVRTLYSKTEINLPGNFSLLATMNNTDQSIDDLDQALLRRFNLVQMYPNYQIMQKGKKEDEPTIDEAFQKYLPEFPVPSEWLFQLNQRLCEKKKSPAFQIGHSYFFDVRNAIKRAKDAGKNGPAITATARKALLVSLFRKIIPTAATLLGHHVGSMRSAFYGLLNIDIFGQEKSGFLRPIKPEILHVLDDQSEKIDNKTWKILLGDLNFLDLWKKATHDLTEYPKAG